MYFTEYDVTNYFRSEVSYRERTVENTTSDGFRWNLSRKIYARILPTGQK